MLLSLSHPGNAFTDTEPTLLQWKNEASLDRTKTSLSLHVTARVQLSSYMPWKSAISPLSASSRARRRLTGQISFGICPCVLRHETELGCFTAFPSGTVDWCRTVSWTLSVTWWFLSDWKIPKRVLPGNESPRNFMGDRLFGWGFTAHLSHQSSSMFFFGTTFLNLTLWQYWSLQPYFQRNFI